MPKKYKKRQLKYFVKDIREKIESKSGYLFPEYEDDQFIQARIYVYIECQKKHRFRSRVDRIMTGSWCRKCNGQKRYKYTIDDMKYLAKVKKVGSCLSEKYQGVKTKLKWKCFFGHEWMATPNSILQGKWCRTCHLKKLAESRTIHGRYKK